MFVFRELTIEDLDAVVQIAKEGKELLKNNGIKQWQSGSYPDRKTFLQDVEDGIGYVISEGKEIIAVCAVVLADEISYRHLLSGSWKTSDDAVYATVHRAAVAQKHRGKNIAGFLFESVAKLAAAKGAVSVRADTHPDNAAMNRSLQKAGFEMCGRLILQTGDEAGDMRYGYEKLISD